MTAPTFFAVEYAINPWMDTSTPVDTHVAMNQWETLRQTYKELGHTVELVEPVAGLPDMVYAANGGLLVNGKAVVARFAYPQRAGESAAYAEWMTRHGFDPAETRHVNEGQGDLLVVGSIVLAGYGFRTDRQAHDEIAGARRGCRWSASSWSTRASTTSTPRWRCSTTPPSPTTRRRSATSRARSCSSCSPTPSRWPAPTPTCSASTPCPTACNVVHARRRHRLRRAALREAGFRPIGVDLSELLKGGGSVKCCTLEVHP